MNISGLVISRKDSEKTLLDIQKNKFSSSFDKEIAKFGDFYHNLPQKLKIYDLGSLVSECVNKYGDDKNMKAICALKEEDREQKVMLTFTELQTKAEFKIDLGHISKKEVITEQYKKIEPLSIIVYNFGGEKAYDAFKDEMYKIAKELYFNQSKEKGME